MPVLAELAPNTVSFLRVLESMNVPVGVLYLSLGHTFKVMEPWTKASATMGQCYMNASKLALVNPGLVYCEGWAYKPGIIPLHHAWCINKEGVVLDPTWGTGPGHEYLGVGLNRDFYFDYIEHKGVWGMLGDVWPSELLDRSVTEYLDPRWLPGSVELEKLERFTNSMRVRRG